MPVVEKTGSTRYHRDPFETQFDTRVFHHSFVVWTKADNVLHIDKPIRVANFPWRCDIRGSQNTAGLWAGLLLSWSSFLPPVTETFLGIDIADS